jgi:hypothetical protein
MAAQDLETMAYKDKQYVSLKAAAKFLGISRHWLEDMILLGKVEATRIESRLFIELETLKTFAEKCKPKASAWDRLDEWRK